MLLAAHTLVECFAVLTRVPPPGRLSPAMALAFLRRAFIEPGTVVALPAENYVAFLESVVATNVSGGRTYDALILATARFAGATVLLTFNARHFANLAQDVTVIEPALA